MEKKNKNVNPLTWIYSLNIIEDLYNKGQIRLSLFLAVAVNTGLKIGEIRKLKWVDLLNSQHIEKNGIKVELSDGFKKFIFNCYKTLNINDLCEHCFISQKLTVYSTQRLNIILKDIQMSYGIEDVLTTMTLRRVFGNRFLDCCNDIVSGILLLQKYFNHATAKVTCNFLNINPALLEENTETTISIGDFHCNISYNEEVNKNIKDNGFVYIMADELYPDYYKIGKSKYPMLREKTLLHNAPTIVLFKVVQTVMMSKLEKELHKVLANRRVRGEWFKLPKEELDVIIEQYNFVDPLR